MTASLSLLSHRHHTISHQALRYFTLKHGEVVLSVPLPSDLYPIAEQLRDLFDHTSLATPSVPTDLTEIELAAEFLLFIILHSNCTSSTPLISENSALPLDNQSLAFLLVARQLFLHLKGERYFGANDPHASSLVLNLPDVNRRQRVLRAYFTTLYELRKEQLLLVDESQAPRTALDFATSTGRAKLLAIFGGQGNDANYFDKFTSTYKTYEPFVNVYVKRMSMVLKKCVEQSGGKMFNKGLDVFKWLERPELRPDDGYLIAAPVSLPLIGLTQLLHLYVMCKVSDRTPDQCRGMFSGTLVCCCDSSG
jgi:hypothetical protein